MKDIHSHILWGIDDGARTFDESIKITQEQGYLNKIIQFKSENPETNEQFKEIREIVDLYIKDRIKNIC